MRTEARWIVPGTPQECSARSSGGIASRGFRCPASALPRASQSAPATLDVPNPQCSALVSVSRAMRSARGGSPRSPIAIDRAAAAWIARFGASDVELDRFEDSKGGCRIALEGQDHRETGAAGGQEIRVCPVPLDQGERGGLVLLEIHRDEGGLDQAHERVDRPAVGRGPDPPGGFGRRDERRHLVGLAAEEPRHEGRDGGKGSRQRPAVGTDLGEEALERLELADPGEVAPRSDQQRRRPVAVASRERVLDRGRAEPLFGMPSGRPPVQLGHELGSLVHEPRSGGARRTGGGSGTTSRSRRAAR